MGEGVWTARFGSDRKRVRGEASFGSSVPSRVATTGGGASGTCTLLCAEDTMLHSKLTCAGRGRWGPPSRADNYYRQIRLKGKVVDGIRRSGDLEGRKKICMSHESQRDSPKD